MFVRWNMNNLKKFVIKFPACLHPHCVSLVWFRSRLFTKDAFKQKNQKMSAVTVFCGNTFCTSKEFILARPTTLGIQRRLNHSSRRDVLTKQKTFWMFLTLNISIFLPFACCKKRSRKFMFQLKMFHYQSLTFHDFILYISVKCVLFLCIPFILCIDISLDWLSEEIFTQSEQLAWTCTNLQLVTLNQLEVERQIKIHQRSVIKCS